MSLAGRKRNLDGEERDSNGHSEIPSLTRPLTEEEEAEARRLADIAARAEMKARLKQNGRSDSLQNNTSTDLNADNKSSKTKVQFLTKKEREELALKRLAEKREQQQQMRKDMEEAHDRFISGKLLEEKRQQERMQREKEEADRLQRCQEEHKDIKEHEHEVKSIHQQYLGVREKKKRVYKPSEKFTRIFQFEWEETDDTTRNDLNPLYTNKIHLNPLFGRGYIAGVDLKEQRQQSNYLLSLSQKRTQELYQHSDLTAEQKEALAARAEENTQMILAQQEEEDYHWSSKPLTAMTERDWRIFREDFDIRIQGGRASLPLRYWSEAAIPEKINRAIAACGYEHPTPIQRQAIPIGLERRDIIGIAETGSGKTAAFLIPLLSYMSSLPSSYIERCCDEGPLAIIMAPTRELAQQIEEECNKLAQFTGFSTACVVGGQSIEEQGFKLRRGVEIVIGTPGRMMDCIENNYLVLNQCNYVVLDEADRMIDMGFEPQVIAILQTMGGLLKSEDESTAEQQVLSAQAGNALFRVTAMFSATMPPEVERIAKTFLRHPAVIKIGDEDTGKNKRIEQIVLFVNEGQKKNILLDELRRLSETDKVIIFVNAKKQGDVIGRFLESSGFHAGVLHGGKSQDQREETLELFRSGEYQVLVATDVAGRGLDIPNVTHVYNFDMSSKIENYCHRIGRTGRAGKSGKAITFLTEGDTEVMYELKTYLESTNSNIPPQLQNHAAAKAPAGTRDASGKLVAVKKDQIMYAKK